MHNHSRININRPVIIIGSCMLIISILFFLERGYFASLLFSANVVGNTGWNVNDITLINRVVLLSCVLLVSGMAALVFGFRIKLKDIHPDD